MVARSLEMMCHILTLHCTPSDNAVGVDHRAISNAADIEELALLFRASHFLQCSCCCGFGCVYSQAEYVPETEQVSFCLA